MSRAQHPIKTLEDQLKDDPTLESQLRKKLGETAHPLKTDSSAFGQWLRSQIKRKDPVGQLARVASGDPFWPGGADFRALRKYFVDMGARQHVLRSLDMAWDEFNKDQKRASGKAKRKAQKEARRKNRQARNRGKKR